MFLCVCVRLYVCVRVYVYVYVCMCVYAYDVCVRALVSNACEALRVKPPQEYSVRAVLLATSYWNGKLEWIKFILFAKLSRVKFHLLGAKCVVLHL